MDICRQKLASAWLEVMTWADIEIERVFGYDTAMKNITVYCTRLLLLSCCLLAQADAQWQSQYYRDHPLAGKIYSTQERAWISEQTLIARLNEARLLLLGETHTNFDHHSRQAHIIQEWMAGGPGPSLVLEMINYQDSEQLQSPKFNLDTLKGKLEEIAGQWNWQVYTPILELKLAHNLPMLGANLSRQQLDQFSRQGKCEISRPQARLNICQALNEAQKETIRQLVFDGHCGYLPLERTEPLMQIQIAKDASFALSLAKAGADNKAVLIAGSVHVRKDIGVPVHLRALGRTFVSMTFMNVAPAKTRFEDYMPASPAADSHRQLFDYIYFTPSDRNLDPCVEFAEQLKKMRQVKKSQQAN